MIEEDRELFTRLARVNTNLGSVVMEVLNHQNANGVTSEALRALADGLESVVTELQALAQHREVIDVDAIPEASRLIDPNTDDRP